MAKKPTYEQLEQRVKELTKNSLDHRQVEDELLNTKLWLENIFNSLEEAVFVVTADRKLVNLNAAAQKMFGYSREELENLSTEVLHVDHEHHVEFGKRIKEAFDKTKSATFEFEVKTKNGEIFPTDHTVSLLKNNQGEPLGIVSVVRDRTERKRTEQKLQKAHDELQQRVKERTKELAEINEQLQREIEERKQAEEVLRAERNNLVNILNSMADGVYIVNQQYDIEYVNPVLMKEFGLWVGRKCYEYFHDRKEACPWCKNQDVLAGKTVRWEWYSLKNQRTYDLIDTPLKNPDGTISKLEIFRDITDLKQAEEAVRKSEARYRELVQNANSVILRRDTRGNITFFNEFAQSFFGYNEDEILGENVIGTIVPETDSAGRNLAAMIRDIGLHPERYASNENENMRRNGDRVWIAWTNKAIRDEDGNIVEILCVGNDITERKEVELELKESRRQLRNLSAYLQSAREQERTTIAREIHDELGQVLTALKMDLSWLNKKLPKDPKALLEKTVSMTELIDTTIQSVKRISSELRPGLLDDLGLTAAMEWMAEEFRDRTGIKCELSVDPEEIILDEDVATAIFRIFQETLTNTTRHANATQVKVILEKKAGTLLLTVTDNGKGITEKQILEPESFGLIGMRERAYYLAGEFNIRGIRGKGTEVTVKIPVEEG